MTCFRQWYHSYIVVLACKTPKREWCRIWWKIKASSWSRLPSGGPWWIGTGSLSPRLIFRHGCVTNQVIHCRVIFSSKYCPIRANSCSELSNQLEIEVYPILLHFILEPPVDLPKKGRVEEAEFYFSKSISLTELKRNACFQVGAGSPTRVR